MRRVRVALGAAAALGLGACAAALGLGGSTTDVADAMCHCDELGFLVMENRCQDYIEGQLESASDADRAAWLEAYAAGCTSCPKVLDCYYRAPVCATTTCIKPNDCCGYRDGGGCNAGRCY